MDSLVIQEHGDSRVVYDQFAHEKKSSLREFLASESIAKIFEQVGRDCIMVLGGDGTMLRAVQSYHQENKPFLGVNFGTKWFLLNDADHVQSATSFESLSYPLLEAEVTIGEETIRQVAFNEIQVKTASGGMADLVFDIGKHSRVRTKWDGLLVSTPAGSTGYNQSAFWPVLPHTSKHFIATPILPFEPKGLRPIVYEANEELTISNIADRPRKLAVYADSITLIEWSSEPMKIVVREFQERVTLLIADSYVRIWRAKTFAEQGLEVL